MNTIKKWTLGACTFAMFGALSATASAQSTFEYKQQTVDADSRHLPTALNGNGWVGSVQNTHDGFYWNAVSQVTTSSFSGITELVMEDLNSSGAYAGYDAHNYTGKVGSIAGGPSTTLQPCGSASPSLPTSISETGLVGGIAFCSGQSVAFLYDDVTGTYPTISGLGGPHSAILDVSSSGQYAAGWQGTSSNPNVGIATYYTSGAYAYGKYAYANTSATQAVRYDVANAQLDTLTHQITGVPAGYSVIASTALGANDDGAVVGYATIQSGSTVNEVPVIWPNASAGWVVPMPTTSPSGCRATAINASWQVVGTCFDRGTLYPTTDAFVWDITEGTRVLEGVTQNASQAYREATDINDYGQITVALDRGHPFYHDPGVALLTPTSMDYGACVVGSSCNMMYSNQCDGFANSSFNGNVHCIAKPPKHALFLTP